MENKKLGKRKGNSISSLAALIEVNLPFLSHQVKAYHDFSYDKSFSHVHYLFSQLQHLILAENPLKHPVSSANSNEEGETFDNNLEKHQDNYDTKRRLDFGEEELALLVDNTYDLLFSSRHPPKKDRKYYRFILSHAFQTLLNPQFSSNYIEQLKREMSFWNSLEKGSLESYLPIFVQAYSVLSNNQNKKAAIDPYSESFYFSDLVLRTFPSLIDHSLLERIAFIYVHPNTFVQVFKKNEEGEYQLLDITQLVEDSANSLQPSDYSSKNGFNLKKASGGGRKGIFSRYLPELIDAKVIDKRMKRLGEPYLRKLYYLEMFPAHREKSNAIKLNSKREKREKSIGEDITIELTLPLLREFLRKRTIIAQRLMALKFAQIINQNYSSFKKQMDAFELDAFPLYMEKTSGAYRIFEFVKDYLTYPFEFKAIGGEQGPLESHYKRLPLKGICEESAFKKLLGFLESLIP